MGAKAGTLTVPGRAGMGPRSIRLLVVSAIVAGGLVVGVIVWAGAGSGASTQNRVVPPQLSGDVVTGTGPGLVRIADRAKAEAQPAVTGTGPGLVQIANESIERR